MGNMHGHVVDFNAEATLMHFNLLRSVGRGSFGKVRIVERKDTKQVYALKYISKRECIRMDALRNVFRERNILESIDHHYVVNLRFSFQDDDYMYMVTDLMLGGDLRFHLLRKPYIEEDELRHWLAELACGLGYLHSRGIMHRDVKPDNILLDEHGHVHLTDFNIATHFNRNRRITSESGTYVYMAPEMFTGKGYTQAVDWWALGVIFYEAMYGRRPFDAPNNDTLKRKIRDDQPNFPAIGRQGRALSIDCIEAMMMFMERDPQRRLCCGTEGWRELRRVKFFEDINWKKIENKESDPVFVPDSERPNFDVAYDLEELLMEQEPLEARPRRKTDLSRMSKEMQLIEKRFKTFDYLLYERYTGLVDSDRMCVGEPPSWVKCVDPPPAPSSDGDSGIGDPSRGTSEENALQGQAHPKSDDQGRKQVHDKCGNVNNTELRRSISSLKQVLFSGKRWSYKAHERDDNASSNGPTSNTDPAWQNPQKDDHGTLMARASADSINTLANKSIQSPAEAVKGPVKSFSMNRQRHTLLVTDNINDLSQGGALAPLMLNTRSNGSNRKPASNIDTDSTINTVYLGQSTISNESPKPVSFMDTGFPVVTHSASFSHGMQIPGDNSLYLSSIEATSEIDISSLRPDPSYSEKLNTPTFTDAQPVERFWPQVEIVQPPCQLMIAGTSSTPHGWPKSVVAQAGRPYAACSPAARTEGCWLNNGNIPVGEFDTITLEMNDIEVSTAENDASKTNINDQVADVLRDSAASNDNGRVASLPRNRQAMIKHLMNRKPCSTSLDAIMLTSPVLLRQSSLLNTSSQQDNKTAPHNNEDDESFTSKLLEDRPITPGSLPLLQDVDPKTSMR